MQHGGDNTYFLLVSGREVTDEFLLSEDFVTHEAFKWKQTFVYLFFFQTVHFTDEVEIFFGSEVINQETIIDESTCELFPVFIFGYIDVIDCHISQICL